MNKILAWGEEPQNDNTELENLKLRDVFPEDERELSKAFDKWISTINEDFIDAYRIGLANSPESMVQYDNFVSCCGSQDVGVTVNGTLYMFGCNYGH